MTKKSFSSVAIFLFLILSGCATAPRGAEYQPIVDVRSGQNYEKDLQECQSFATKAASEAQSAAAGAVAAGLLGAFLAPRGYRNEVAGKAAVLGAAGGAGEGMMTRENIIKKCLVGRGYSVLN